MRFGREGLYDHDLEVERREGFHLPALVGIHSRQPWKIKTARFHTYVGEQAGSQAPADREGLFRSYTHATTPPASPLPYADGDVLRRQSGGADILGIAPCGAAPDVDARRRIRRGSAGAVSTP